MANKETLPSETPSDEPAMQKRRAAMVGGATLEISNRLERPPTYVHVPDKDLAGTPLTEDMVLTTLTETWRKQREAILSFPSHEEGLHMDRVYAFIQSLGLPRKAVRILNLEDFQKVLKITGESRGNIKGKYFTYQDVIIVKRDPELEALNGPGYTESVAVHELAHASMETISARAQIEVSKKRSFLRKKMSTSMPLKEERGGFVVTNESGKEEGIFLEEGFAELIRGMYVVQQLGIPDGFAGRAEPEKPSALNKYMNFERTDSGEVRRSFGPGAITALIFEALISRDPGLFAALKDARNTVEGLRDVARRINSVSPGLYREMRKMADIESTGEQLQELKAVDILKRVRNLTSEAPSSP